MRAVHLAHARPIDAVDHRHEAALEFRALQLAACGAADTGDDGFCVCARAIGELQDQRPWRFRRDVVVASHAEHGGQAAVAETVERPDNGFRRQDGLAVAGKRRDGDVLNFIGVVEKVQLDGFLRLVEEGVEAFGEFSAACGCAPPGSGARAQWTILDAPTKIEVPAPLVIVFRLLGIEPLRQDDETFSEIVERPRPLEP